METISIGNNTNPDTGMDLGESRTELIKVQSSYSNPKQLKLLQTLSNHSTTNSLSSQMYSLAGEVRGGGDRGDWGDWGDKGFIHEQNTTRIDYSNHTTTHSALLPPVTPSKTYSKSFGAGIPTEGVYREQQRTVVDLDKSRSDNFENDRNDSEDDQHNMDKQNGEENGEKTDFNFNLNDKINQNQHGNSQANTKANTFSLTQHVSQATKSQPNLVDNSKNLTTRFDNLPKNNFEQNFNSNNILSQETNPTFDSDQYSPQSTSSTSSTTSLQSQGAKQVKKTGNVPRTPVEETYDENTLVVKGYKKIGKKKGL
jgi:hypothetical protein